ncbi:MAG: hypothetical protein CGW95_09470 [Phenylobacterium zucineum]|nr:MAG: hypothetical protein CGW95_09470 [Phenylobacterium zucineum]
MQREPFKMELNTSPSIDTLKAAIRADLTAAMKARDGTQASLLRVLLAALDNAEAVPVGTGHDRYVLREFGDPAAEVPRQVLSAETLNAMLARERDEREVAAAEFDRLGRPQDAERLRREAAFVARYIPAAS